VSCPHVKRVTSSPYVCTLYVCDSPERSSETVVLSLGELRDPCLTADRYRTCPVYVNQDRGVVKASGQKNQQMGARS